MGLHGVITAMATPFSPAGEVAVERLQRYTDWLVGKGIHALFPCGTNGEGPSMTSAQRRVVAEAVMEAAGGRVPVVIMTGAISTEETVALTRHAQQVGAAGAVVVTPWYFPLDDAALYAHFAAVAEAVPGFDLYLYNIPANAGNSISPSLASRLAERYPSIRGVKDSSKGLDQLKAFVAALPDRSVFAGSDSLFYDGLVAGAHGVVSAIANCFPEEVLAIYQAFTGGHPEDARLLQGRVDRLRAVLKQGPYIDPYKQALRWRGVEVGGMRPPLRSCTAEEAWALRMALERLEVL